MSGRPTSRMMPSMPGGVLGDLEPGRAVGRQLDDVAVVLEQALEQPDEARIVLDDEQVHGGQPTPSALGHDRDVVGGPERPRSVPPLAPVPIRRFAAAVDAGPATSTVDAAGHVGADRRRLRGSRGRRVEGERHRLAVVGRDRHRCRRRSDVTVPSMVGVAAEPARPPRTAAGRPGAKLPSGMRPPPTPPPCRACRRRGRRGRPTDGEGDAADGEDDAAPSSEVEPAGRRADCGLRDGRRAGPASTGQRRGRRSSAAGGRRTGRHRGRGRGSGCGVEVVVIGGSPCHS